MTDNSWITPGASVLVVRASQNGFPSVRHTRVKSVATQSFTTEDPQLPRFRLDTLTTARQGSGFNGFRFKALHPDSTKGRKALAAALHAKAQGDASSAVLNWQRNRTRENRLAAIAALQDLANYE